MPELNDGSISLVVTSPPYWHIKDYGTSNQTGYGQSLHEYLKDLFLVWSECFRVLKPGRRLCINIGDQFARASIYGRYKIIPIHAEFISQCEQIGFDFMGSIIWQKKTTMNPSGGAVIMGSYPHPPNGIIEIDYEHILIFKKPGKPEKIEKDIKEQSRLSKEEWKEYFSGHWNFKGARQIGHEAMFPEELPRRLIRMFSFVGETVMDPFLGSGTTAIMALALSRNAVGCEINKEFIHTIQEKIGEIHSGSVQFEKRSSSLPSSSSSSQYFPTSHPPTTSYEPRVQNAHPLTDPENVRERKENLFKVVDVVDESTIKLEDGRHICFLGVKVTEKKRAIEYLKKSVLKKQVFLRDDHTIDRGEEGGSGAGELAGDTREVGEAYVYLKNHIFINAHLIKSGLGVPDREGNHRLKNKFQKLRSKPS